MLRNKETVVYPDLSYSICGLCFKVHNQLGRFRNEKQYGDALEEIFKANKISYEREKRLPASFEGEKPARNIIDFLVDGKIILELKAKRIITTEDYYQMKRYLVSLNKDLGIIVNFRQEYLMPKRVVNSRHSQKNS